MKDEGGVRAMVKVKVRDEYPRLGFHPFQVHKLFRIKLHEQRMINQRNLSCQLQRINRQNIETFHIWSDQCHESRRSMIKVLLSFSGMMGNGASAVGTFMTSPGTVVLIFSMRPSKTYQEEQ